MSDFGRILREWESGRRSYRKAVDEPVDDPVSMTSWLESHPLVDKDAGDEGPEARSAPPVRAEDVPVDAAIDLHGHRLAEALQATRTFITASLAAGHRKVLVIHGKGENGQGVLRREVRAWLERHPAVGAMGYARGSGGGRGALWVVLRGSGRSERGERDPRDRQRSR